MPHPLNKRTLLRKLVYKTGRPAPPPIPQDLAQASFAELRRYVRYQLKTCRRLRRDPYLDPAQHKITADRADHLADILKAHPLREDLIRAIELGWNPPPSAASASAHS